MKIKDMIKYFESVQASHIALTESGMALKGGCSECPKKIIKTYTFIINKLKEWDKTNEG